MAASHRTRQSSTSETCNAYFSHCGHPRNTPGDPRVHSRAQPSPFGSIRSGRTYRPSTPNPRGGKGVKTRFCFRQGLPELFGCENTVAPRWLMHPYDHILPILRERVAHMPYKYLESFKTILSDCLSENLASRSRSPLPHSLKSARTTVRPSDDGIGRRLHVRCHR